MPTLNLRYQAPDGKEQPGDARVTPNKLGFTQGVYIERIKSIGEKEGCIVIDIQQATGFTFEEMERYFPDGVHPSKTGYEVISKFFASAINKATGH